MILNLHDKTTGARRVDVEALSGWEYYIISLVGSTGNRLVASRDCLVMLREAKELMEPDEQRRLLPTLKVVGFESEDAHFDLRAAEDRTTLFLHLGDLSLEWVFLNHILRYRRAS